MFDGLLLFLLLGSPIFGLMTASVNRQRGHSAIVGFIVGLCLGPIGLLLAVLSPKNNQALEQRMLKAGKGQKCPHCANVVRAEARVCQFCSRNIAPAVAV